MATFSENQVRHLYVVGKSEPVKSPHVLATDAAGCIAVKNDTAKTHLYFEYKGADNVMRSDLIDTKNIISAKATDADSMKYTLKSKKITLDSTVNGGNVVAGQDYLLRLTINPYLGMSDEEPYFKYGMVHGYTGMTASEFYKVLAISLAKNFSRENTPMIEVGLIHTTSTYVKVDALTKKESLRDTYEGVIITELELEWQLGVKSQEHLHLTIEPTTITVDNDELVWGKVTEYADKETVLHNGKLIADLEYFCMGERGDQYRLIGWPNVIYTKYLVDPAVAYNCIDIHYAYVGENEGVQKSEKTITLVVPKIGETNSVSNVLTNSIITAINSATGLSIPILGTEAE